MDRIGVSTSDESNIGIFSIASASDSTWPCSSDRPRFGGFRGHSSTPTRRWGRSSSTAASRSPTQRSRVTGDDCCWSSPTAAGLAAPFRSRHWHRAMTGSSMSSPSRTRLPSAASACSSTRCAAHTFGIPPWTPGKLGWYHSIFQARHRTKSMANIESRSRGRST